MPELPEVEVIARKLRSELLGRSFVDVEVLWARSIAAPDVAAFVALMQGARIDDVTRRGKYIVMRLADDWTMLAHLRMSGKFRVSAPLAPAEDSYARVRWRLDDGRSLLFCDPRKFGRLHLSRSPETLLDKLGPEPLADAFTPAALGERLRNRRGEIKRLLLDQHFVAGVGNIYASEALWRAQIHPQRVAGSLSEPEVQRLHAGVVSTLAQAIEHGGTSLADRQYVLPDGETGQHQEALAVYAREGDPCPRCAAPVLRIVQGQRSTYFCATCQVLKGNVPHHR